MERYIVVEGSQSGHCCFDATVVDTSRPVVYNETPYAPNGVQRYEPVCECFDNEDARAIADALNATLPPREEPRP